MEGETERAARKDRIGNVIDSRFKKQKVTFKDEVEDSPLEIIHIVEKLIMSSSHEDIARTPDSPQGMQKKCCRIF
jgi:hypothetical protein